MSNEKYIWVKFQITDQEHKALFAEVAKQRNTTDRDWWTKFLRKRLTRGLKIKP